MQDKNGRNLSGTPRPSQTPPLILKPSNSNSLGNLDGGGSPRSSRMNQTISMVTQGGTPKVSQTRQTTPLFSTTSGSMAASPQMRINIPSNEHRKSGSNTQSRFWHSSMNLPSGYESARLKWLQRRDYRRKVSTRRNTSVEQVTFEIEHNNLNSCLHNYNYASFMTQRIY